MKGSNLNPLDNDTETSILEGLIDKYGATFSLKQIATAYCKAGRDANLTGALLHELSNSTRMQPPNKVPKSEESSEVSHTDVSEESPHGVLESSKSENYHVSRASSQVSHTDAFEESSHGVLESSKPGNYHVSRVLGKSYRVKTLLDLSAVASEKRDDFFIRSRQRSAYRSPKLEATSCAGGNLKLDVKANGSKLPRKHEGHIDIQCKVLSDLFHAPGSSKEFHSRRFGVNVVKKSKASGQAKVEASTDTAIECKTVKTKPPNSIEEDDEGDYGVLRKAVREYRATGKEYYKSAADAFAKGDLSLGGRLLEEGKLYCRKAREADEESAAGISFGPRNEETTDTVTLDLHENGAKEAIRNLKCHLSSLCGIPSMKYLKIIVETNDEDASKGSRKRHIIKLLEKESIVWTEAENPGTMLIPLEEINPKLLSFARK